MPASWYNMAMTNNCCRNKNHQMKQYTSLQLIQHINQIIACSQLDELLSLTLDFLISMTDSGEVAVYLYYPETQLFELKAQKNQPTYEATQLDDRFFGASDIAQYLLQLETSLLVSDITSVFPLMRMFCNQADYRKPTAYILPMRTQQQCLGVVCLFQPSSDTISDPEHVGIVQSFGNIVTSQIDKILQFHVAQRRVNRLMDLVDIMANMFTTLESNQLLDDIMMYARELLDVETTSIWIKDDQTGDLILHVATGTPTEQASGIRVPSGRGIIGHVINTGYSVIVNDVHQNEHFYGVVDQRLHFTTRAILCVPLKAHTMHIAVDTKDLEQPTAEMDRTEIIIGGAQALNKRDGGPFTEEDKVLFEIFSSQAATILQILWLYEANTQEQRKRANAEASSLAKSIFLSNMSHELRTPLNAIIGYSELLAEDVQDIGAGEIVEDLNKIRSSGVHLLSIINDILDISKIEAGQMKLCIETFEVTMVVDYVLMVVETEIRKKGNTLEVKMAPDLGTIVSDMTKIRLILNNLLKNANKFTDDGHITFLIKRMSATDAQTHLSKFQSPSNVMQSKSFVLQTHDEIFDTSGQTSSDWIMFQVTDTGMGMTAEQVEHIFEAFTQADTSTTRKHGGTGLGLAIARSFCRMMDGDILVESILGQGSTFTVWIPAIIPQI